VNESVKAVEKLDEMVGGVWAKATTKLLSPGWAEHRAQPK